MNSISKNIFYILIFLAMISWGASWVNAKVLSAYINEYELLFFRNILTTITLAPILIFTRKYFYINLRSLILAVIVAIVMIIYVKFFFLGTKFGTASLGGAFVTTLIPIITFILMALFFGKKIEKKDVFALFLGAIGVMTILNIWSFSYESIFLIQNLYFIFAAISWPILTILSSKITNTSPIVFTFYMYLIGSIIVTIFFVDIGNMNYEKFDNIFWLNILSFSIISTAFATTIYFLGIEKLGTNEVSSFIFLVPISAIILSIIFLDEILTIPLVIGTILTLSSVKILNNIKLFKDKKA